MDKKDFIVGAGGGDSRSPVRTPDSLLSQDYFEVLLALGEGPIKGLVTEHDAMENFFAGDTPVYNVATGQANFSDFAATLYSGADTDPEIDLKLGGQASNTPVGVALASAVPVVRTTPSIQRGLFDQIEIRLYFNYLARQDSSGVYEATAQFNIQYKATNSGTWLNYEGQAVTEVTGKTVNGYARDFIIEVPKVNFDYDLRVTKVSPDGTQGVDETVVSITWESFQLVTRGKAQYEDLALMHIYGKASNQFNSLPEFSGIYDGLIVRVPTNYNPETRVYDEGTPWNGTFKQAFTNNPVWILYELITNTRFGMARYVPSVTANRYEFYEEAKWCDTMVSDGRTGQQPRFTFNANILDAKAGMELLTYIAGSFNATLHDDGNGVITLRSDRPRAATQIFTPENVSVEGFSYTFADINSRYNDIVAKFVNPALDWREDQRAATLDNTAYIAKNGRVPYEFVAVGCTDAHEAVRRANYRLIVANHEVTTVSFITSRFGLMCEPLGTIYVCDPLADWAISGRFKSVSGSTIHLGRPLYFATTAARTMKVQTYDGLVSLTVVPPSTGEVLTLTITVGTLTPGTYPDRTTFVIEDMVAIGLAKPFRVLTIEEVEGKPDKIQISALEVAEDKYEDAETGATYSPTQYAFARPGDPVLPASMALSSPAPIITSDGSLYYQIEVSWKRPPAANTSRYEIDFKLDGEASWSTKIEYGDRAFLGPVRDGGTYTVRLYAVSPAGQRSQRCLEDTITVAKKTGTLANVAGLTTVATTVGWEIRWDPQSGIADYEGVEIRVGTTAQAWAALPTKYKAKASPQIMPWLATGTHRINAKHTDTSGNSSAAVAYYDLAVSAPATPTLTVSRGFDSTQVLFQDCQTTQPLKEIQIRLGGASSTWDTATPTGSGGATQRVITVMPSATTVTKVYVRAVDIAGNTSAVAVAEIPAAAGDVATLLGWIENGIDDALSPALLERIDLIDAADTVPGSVAARIKALSDSVTTDLSLVQGDITDLQGDVTGINGELDGIDASILSLTGGVAGVNTRVNELVNTPTYDNARAYTLNEMVVYNGSIYRALGPTTGNLPTNQTYWQKVGDYTSVGQALAAHTSTITTVVDDLGAEIEARQLLHTQVNDPTTGLPATRATLASDYFTKTGTNDAIAAATSTLVTQTALTTTLGSYATNATLTQNYYTKTGTNDAISAATSTLVSQTALNTTLNSYVTNATLTSNHYTKTATDSAIAASALSLTSSLSPFEAQLSYNFDSSLEGWTGDPSTSTTVTQTGGMLQVSATTNDPIIRSPSSLALDGAKFNLIRARIKRMAGAGWQGGVYFVNGSHDESDSHLCTIADTTVLNEWRILEWNMMSTSDWASGGPISRIRMDLGNSSADVFQIDWITVGRIAPQNVLATLTQNYYTKTGTDDAISVATSTLVSQTALNTTLGSYVTNANLTTNYFTKTDTNDAIAAATSTLVSNTSLATTLGSYATNANLTTNYFTKTGTNDAITAATSALVSNTALTTTLGSYVTNAHLTTNYFTKTDTNDAISAATSALVSTTTLTTTLGSYVTNATLTQDYYTKTDTNSAISSAVTTLRASSVGFEAGAAWNFDSSTEGWLGTRAIVTQSGGVLHVNSDNSNDPVLVSPSGLTIDGGKYWLLRARVMRKAGSGWQGSAYYETAGHGQLDTYRKDIADTTVLNQWVVLEWDMFALTYGGADWGSNVITRLRFDLGASAADQFDIDWITVGRESPQPYMSMISTEQSARASADGHLGAQWALKVALLQSNSIAEVGGIAIAGTSSETQGARFDMSFRANAFYFLPPSGSGDTQYAPLSYYSTPTVVNGVTVQPGLYTKAAFIETIQASQIDTRGLTIKDNFGNILFGSGQNLDWSRIQSQPAGIYNSNISISGGAISGIGTGDGTAVANSSIGISGGAISGIGTGNNTLVANSVMSLSGTGQLLNNGTPQGQVTSVPTVDLGNGSVFGSRNRNDPPSEYPLGTIRQFKQASSIGLSAGDGTFCTLETIKQYADASGGSMYQYAYQQAKTWRRSAANPASTDAATWGSWTLDLDRNAYTGDLDATKDLNLLVAGMAYGLAGASGTYGIYFVATATTTQVQIKTPVGPGTFALDSISMKKRASDGTLGAELVTNGTFSSGITSWASLGTPVSVTWDNVNQRLLGETDAINEGVYQNITTEIGAVYYLQAYLERGTASELALTTDTGRGFSLNAVVTGNKIAVTSASSWYTSVHSKDGFTGGAYVSFTPDSHVMRFMMGLTAQGDIAYPHYETIDYALYCTDSSTLRAYENNTDYDLGTSYAAGDVLAVYYDGFRVRYSKNGVVIRTVTPAAPITSPLFLDSSFFDTGSVSNIRFAPMSSVGGITDAQVDNLDVNTLTAGVDFNPHRVWDFVDSVLGWTANNCSTFSAANGELTAVSNGSDQYIYSPAFTGFSGRSYNKVRARIKRTAGTGWDGLIYYAIQGGHDFHGSYYARATNVADVPADGKWYIVEWDMANLFVGGTDWLDNTITQIRLDLATATGSTFLVDWVAIGRHGPMYIDENNITTYMKAAAVGSLDVSMTGAIRSGKTAFSDDANSGYWIGMDSGTPKFKFGAGSGNRIYWDGTDLKIEYKVTNLVERGPRQNMGIGDMDTQFNSDTATATFYMYADGTTNGSGNWHVPTEPNVGANYWVRFTRQAGSAASGDAMDTWHQLSSSRTLSLSATGATKEAYGKIEISSTNNGSNIVATGTYSLIAESFTGNTIP